MRGYDDSFKATAIQFAQVTIKFPTKMVVFITDLISNKSGLYNRAHRKLSHQLKTG